MLEAGRRMVSNPGMGGADPETDLLLLALWTGPRSIHRGRGDVLVPSRYPVVFVTNRR